MSYEYKVVPAPTRGLKAKGIKTAEDRFANALETAMNELAADGWEYQRTDTLPAEQREGLMSKTTVFQNMLVFRRPVTKAAGASAPAAAEPLPLVATTERSEPELTATADRSAPPVNRPVPTPERLTPELKKELMEVEQADKPDKKPDVAAE